MCGIFLSVSSDAPVRPDTGTERLLRCRGPDSCETQLVSLGNGLHLTFVSTVLALRGEGICKQPLVDAQSGCVLCWNGEAWKIDDREVTGNDSQAVFELLLGAARWPHDGTDDAENLYVDNFINALRKVSGPFAIVFYDAWHGRVFFGRDQLGRRSLLQRHDELGNLVICSASDGANGTFTEVVADGVYSIDLQVGQLAGRGRASDAAMPWRSVVRHHGWHKQAVIKEARDCLKEIEQRTLPPTNQSVPPGNEAPTLTVSSKCIDDLQQRLLAAVRLRTQRILDHKHGESDKSAQVAVLYSGGLDCSILARLTHEVMAPDAVIDLLNVAFENPRVIAAAKAACRAATGNSRTASVFERCPDRMTGRSSYAELRRVCPGRNFRFVAIDVPYSETLAHRDEIIRLMAPHDTEMDLSIASAFYFAARGRGAVADDDAAGEDIGATVPYTTAARVLLSGLGADELFGGYTRHGTAFRRQGFPELIAELDLDVSRLGQRNLGRDDRVLSHWGREARYPFLDEEFVRWALALPVWEKTGFGQVSNGEDPCSHLDPEKKALRLLAWKLGLKGAAREKKRAVQFGSRTAKMESGKTKGDQRLGE